MTLTIPQHILVKPLEQAAAAVSSRLVMPVLDGIYFKVTSSQMEIVGSDGGTTIKVSIPSENFRSDGDWTFVLPHKKIVESVKRMEGDISFTAKDDKVLVKSGRSMLELTALEADEYPLQENIIGQTIQIPGKSLKELVAKTIFAVAEPKDQTTILTGLHFQFSKSQYRVIGCDRHRMAYIQVPMEEDTGFDASIVVKSEDINKIIKLITEKETIELKLGNSQIQAKIGRVEIIARLLEGTYPDVTKTFPQSINTVITVKTREFAKALEFANIIATGENTRIVKMMVGDEIEFKANNSSGAATRSVEYDNISGKGFSLSFNAGYVMDAIKAIDHEFTTIHYCKDGNPIVFRGEDQQNETFLVLPYRTRE